MNDAQRQIEAAVATAKRKGMMITGYHPVVGPALHPDGSHRLVIDMAKPGVWAKMVDMAKEAQEPRSKRGALAVAVPAPAPQGSLL